MDPIMLQKSFVFHFGMYNDGSIYVFRFTFDYICWTEIDIIVTYNIKL